MVLGGLFARRRGVMPAALRLMGKGMDGPSLCE